MFRCPYLDGAGGEAECVRHGTRWENCRVFPVDERDLADRDLVSRNGSRNRSRNRSCGYSFDPPKKPQRWLALAVAALAGLAGVAGPARAAETEEAERATPLLLRASFASGRAPEGWRIESGTWEPARKGLRAASEDARLAATLRGDIMPVSGVDFRAEVWATFETEREISISSPGPVFDVGVKWGELEAGIGAIALRGHTAVAFPGERRVSGLDLDINVGRFRTEIALERGLVSVRVGRERAFTVRDVFGKLVENAPRDVIVTAAPGTVVHAVRVSATPARARAEQLDRADRAWREGDRRRAAVSYMEALSDASLSVAVRAEAACKLGWHFEESESFIDAARSFDRAQKLDPEGPWAERARVALGRAALAVGDARTALAFARAAAQRAGPHIEDWAGFSRLVTRARKRLAESREAPRATYALRRIAEQIEWARSAPSRTQWAWEEVALSLEGRGWEAEADAVRRRAMSVLGRRVEVATSPAELTSGRAATDGPKPGGAPTPSPSDGPTE
jgi:tetratricopeptide (TPR) repeat protein